MVGIHQVSLEKKVEKEKMEGILAHSSKCFWSLKCLLTFHGGQILACKVPSKYAKIILLVVGAWWAHSQNKGLRMS